MYKPHPRFLTFADGKKVRFIQRELRYVCVARQRMHGKVVLACYELKKKKIDENAAGLNMKT